eukprot:356721-Chlamydomonas_euryale.AAC.6
MSSTLDGCAMCREIPAGFCPCAQRMVAYEHSSPSMTTSSSSMWRRLGSAAKHERRGRPRRDARETIRSTMLCRDTKHLGRTASASECTACMATLMHAWCEGTQLRCMSFNSGHLASNIAVLAHAHTSRHMC